VLGSEIAPTISATTPTISVTSPLISAAAPPVPGAAAPRYWPGSHEAWPPLRLGGALGYRRPRSDCGAGHSGLVECCGSLAGRGQSP
jgi:hypothetical protein